MRNNSDVSLFRKGKIAKKPSQSKSIHMEVKIIDIHPALDPREPRFLSQEREEAKQKESQQAGCCWGIGK